jgi:hypothetical protein
MVIPGRRSLRRVKPWGFAPIVVFWIVFLVENIVDGDTLGAVLYGTGIVGMGILMIRMIRNPVPVTPPTPRQATLFAVMLGVGTVGVTVALVSVAMNPVDQSAQLMLLIAIPIVWAISIGAAISYRRKARTSSSEQPPAA